MTSAKRCAFTATAPGVSVCGIITSAMLASSSSSSPDTCSRFRARETFLGSETHAGSNHAAAEARADEKVEILTLFEEKQEEVPEETRFFYQRTRGLILQGYQTSQHFLTDVKPYQLVPGPDYRGCVPVSNQIKPIS